MTYSFWAALAMLTAMALAFLFYPLFFSSRAQRQLTDRRSQNLTNYRYRLAELESDLQAQRIDRTNFENLKDELDAALLEDVGESDSMALPAAGNRRGILAVALIGMITLPLLAFGLYDRWGASDALVQAQTLRALEENGPTSPEQMDEMLAKLRAHLEEEPDNPDGWALLGRSNMQLQRYGEAARAYEGLARQLGREPIAATAWGLVAQARYMASGRQWNDSIADAIGKAREIDEDEVNSLGLLGIAAFEKEAYQRAAEYWSRILEVAPDYPQYASIANGVASAYRAMNKPIPEPVRELLRQSPSAPAVGGAGSAKDSPDASESAATGAPASIARPAAEGESESGASVNAASVTVKVELANDLPRPDDDAVVFVFARAVTGPPMPLAVARLSARDLPATVTLDDSMAMTPQARLSSTGEVIIGARISNSGTANPSPGDLEGFSEPKAVSAEMGTVDILIDSQRR